MRNVPGVKLFLINKLYNVLIFSFPIQYYTAQLSCDYVSTHNRHYVTYCLFITMFIMSLIQL